MIFADLDDAQVNASGLFTNVFKVVQCLLQGVGGHGSRTVYCVDMPQTITQLTRIQSSRYSRAEQE